jgi:hypothetical protein
MLRVAMKAAMVGWIVLVSVGLATESRPTKAVALQATVMRVSGRVLTPDDSLAFRLVMTAARDLLPGAWSADPGILKGAFPAPIDGAGLAASYEVEQEAANERSESLRRWGIREVDARAEINCVTGITPPGVPKTTDPYCLRLVPHYGLVASRVWEASVDTTSYGLLGSEAPWRIRVLLYWVSPTTEGGWSLYDYFLQPAGDDWRVVGRRTILHAN